MTMPCWLQRVQPFVDLFVTCGMEMLNVPQNSTFTPLLSDERSGIVIDGSYESRRSPFHTTACVFEIPVPSNVTLPAVPSRRDHAPEMSSPPAIKMVLETPSIFRLADGMPRYTVFDVADGHFCASVNGQVFETENVVVRTAPREMFHVTVEPTSDQVVDPFVLTIEPVIVLGSTLIPVVGLNVVVLDALAFNDQLFSSENDASIPNFSPLPPRVTVAVPVTVPLEVRETVIESTEMPAPSDTLVRVAFCDPEPRAMSTRVCRPDDNAAFFVSAWPPEELSERPRNRARPASMTMPTSTAPPM
ncbi:MAG: hypothetical protein EBU67_06380 [Actinobacteria bacterium]|nr:hypothetical protein [Actinomycetota bacterium]